MRLFQRIGDIIAANLNDLVDRFEDPEVMLKQAIREMETMIESATGGGGPRHRRRAPAGQGPVRPRAKGPALERQGGRGRAARRRRSGPPGDRPRTRARGHGPGTASSSDRRPSRRPRPSAVRSTP